MRLSSKLEELQRQAAELVARVERHPKAWAPASNRYEPWAELDPLIHGARRALVAADELLWPAVRRGTGAAAETAALWVGRFHALAERLERALRPPIVRRAPARAVRSAAA